MKKEAFWAEQYRRHIGKMVGACYRYVADWDLAEDLAQDAFLAAMEKASTFRAFGSFEGWLKTRDLSSSLRFRQSSRIYLVRQYLFRRRDQARRYA